MVILLVFSVIVGVLFSLIHPILGLVMGGAAFVGGISKAAMFDYIDAQVGRIVDSNAPDYSQIPTIDEIHEQVSNHYHDNRQVHIHNHYDSPNGLLNKKK
jgi:hypothetical protein